MELAISLAGLAGQLVQVGRECSNIWGDMKDIGNAHNSLVYELRGAGIRLKEWEEAWGLNRLNTSGSGSGHQIDLCLDPLNDKHRRAVECLAMIVATFTKIVKLQSHYKFDDKFTPESAQKDKWYRRLLKSKSRSKSPSMGLGPSTTSVNSQSNRSQEQLDQVNVGLLENGEILSNP